MPGRVGRTIGLDGGATIWNLRRPADLKTKRLGGVMRKLGSACIGLLLSLSAWGCATNIAYKPIASAAPAATSSVGLAVRDERPVDKGGADKSQVGVVRG